MNKKYSDDELLELVLKGNIDSLTLEEIEARKNDINFQKDYIEVLALHQVISTAGRKRAKSAMQDMETSIVAHHRKLRIGITLALAIVFLLWVGFKNLKNSTPPDHLFAEFYEPYPNTIDPLTKGAYDNSLSGTQLYEIGEYDMAISSLQNSPKTSEQNWYLLQAYIANEKYELALPLLEEIIQSNKVFTNSAQWYMALLRLKQSKTAESKKILLEISDTDQHPYQSEAKKLLKKL